MRRLVLVLGVMVGCDGGGEPMETAPPSGACGETTYHQVEVLGAVTSGGVPVEGADVRLEDRGYAPGTWLAEGTTDLDGLFTLDVSDLVAVEDCWGTLLDYVLVAEANGLAGEKPINSQLFSAVDGGSGVADTTAFPIELE